MCGACGGPPPDPHGALVAGPRRRAAVARLVGGPGVTVRAVSGGWTVASRTGATTVCRTLTALLVATTPERERPALLRRITAAATAERTALPPDAVG